MRYDPSTTSKPHVWKELRTYVVTTRALRMEWIDIETTRRMKRSRPFEGFVERSSYQRRLDEPTHARVGVSACVLRTALDHSVPMSMGIGNGDAIVSFIGLFPKSRASRWCRIEIRGYKCGGCTEPSEGSHRRVAACTLPLEGATAPGPSLPSLPIGVHLHPGGCICSPGPEPSPTNRRRRNPPGSTRLTFCKTRGTTSAHRDDEAGVARRHFFGKTDVRSAGKGEKKRARDPGTSWNEGDGTTARAVGQGSDETVVARRTVQTAERRK
eukprot:scaffold833_cov352-Pavlova_lutheri.AAC.32